MLETLRKYYSREVQPWILGVDDPEVAEKETAEKEEVDFPWFFVGKVGERNG